MADHKLPSSYSEGFSIDSAGHVLSTEFMQSQIQDESALTSSIAFKARL